jgi:hypothetical protein
MNNNKLEVYKDILNHLAGEAEGLKEALRHIESIKRDKFVEDVEMLNSAVSHINISLDIVLGKILSYHKNN